MEKKDARLEYECYVFNAELACAAEKTKTFVTPSASQPLFFASAVYEDFSTRHDWPVKRAIVSLANQVERTFETHFR